MAMRALLPLCLVLNACVMPGRIQRIGVDHNEAAAGIANETTLLNILRAREDLPLHYTQINRLTGQFTVRGTAGINDAIREATTTATNQTATTTSANPGTVVTTIQQVAEGVDVITPSIGGEVSITPAVDIAVLDGQKFYQGIIASIPFTTVQNYLSQGNGQGYDRVLLLTLFIERIDFRNADGSLNSSWRNQDPGDAGIFAENIRCYELAAQSESRAAVRLVPVSRLPRTGTGELAGLRLEDLAMLDGTRLELSEPIGASPAGDAQVFVQRPRSDRGGANLRRICPPIDLSTPPAEPVYMRNNQWMEYDADRRSERVIPIQPEIVFRSTEGVIRYLGRYLRAYELNPSSVMLVGNQPVFSVVRGRPSGSIVSATILGRRFSVADDQNRRRNMLVIALVQQLVNLHKESAGPPLTVPVRVLGGG
jgi:hypothetical protein